MEGDSQGSGGGFRADTVSNVVHKSAKPSSRIGERSGLVNNLAAPQNMAGSRKTVSAASRSVSRSPKRSIRRIPVSADDPGTTSERTLPCEGRRISLGRPDQNSGGSALTKTKNMNDWSQARYFAGLDWAGDHHDVVIVDQSGTILAQFRFEHSAQGWSEFRQKIAAYPGLAVAMETRSGPAVEELLQSGCMVFPVQPKAAARYRERKAPSGVKNDQLDAWALADALRLDGRSWRTLAAEDPLNHELRLLCRDEVALIEERTALINQLRAALREFYDTALDAFEDWTHPAAWQFVVAFPDPTALARAGKRRWEKFLHVHKLWRPQTAQKRLELFARADQWKRNEAVSRAKSRLAVSLAKTLLTLENQLEEYRAAIEELFQKHPDHDLFGSLPGAADKLAPRLASEIGQDRARFDSADVLQMLAGTAPISYQSGKMHIVKLRRACNAWLRHTVHLWASCSLNSSAWAAAYYQKKRAEGSTHADALRRLGHRWLEILWKMWQDRSCYNAELHTRNQQKHGSWVFQILPPQKPERV